MSLSAVTSDESKSIPVNSSDSCALEWLQGRETRLAVERVASLTTALYNLHLDRLQLCVVAADKQTHNCNERCKVMHAEGWAYAVRKRTDEYYVAAKEDTMPVDAGKWLHIAQREALGADLYICPETGKRHDCSDERCNAACVVTPDGNACILTGRVRTGALYLSHGWIEDPWNQRMRCTSVTGRQVAPRRPVRDAVARMVDGLRSEEGDNGEGDDSFTASELGTAIEEVTVIVCECIRKLFPWAPLRERSDRDLDTRDTEQCYEKFYRTAVAQMSAGKCVRFDELIQQFRTITRGEPPRWQRYYPRVDGAKIPILARQYAERVVGHLERLIRFTDFEVTTAKLVQLTASILYLSTTPLRLYGVDLVTADPVLVRLLPSSPQIEACLSQPVNITTCKKSIVAAIEAAIRGGVCPTKLILPPLALRTLALRR